MEVDFGRAADDYTHYRAGFPPELLDRLRRFGVGLPGQRILDLGTGTGTLARQFSARGCLVVGVDPSAQMLDQAEALALDSNLSIEFVEALAEDTGLEDDAFDVVTAGQCWHWFDRSKAAREAFRLVKPGGKIVITHFDWLPLPANVVEETEALIVAHNSKWRGAGGHGIYAPWFADLSIAGFVDLESFSFDVSVNYSHEAWRGRIRASAGVGATMPPTEVVQFDAELVAMLTEKFPTAELQVPHRVFCLVGSRHP